MRDTVHQRLVQGLTHAILARRLFLRLLGRALPARGAQGPAEQFLRMLDGLVHAGGLETLAVEAVLGNDRIGTNDNGVGFLDVLLAKGSLDADGTMSFNLDAVAKFLGCGLEVLGRHIGMRDARRTRRDGEDEG